jgi:hypothetical protein
MVRVRAAEQGVLSAEVKKNKQHADMPHLLFGSAQSIVNSARCHQVRSKTGRLVQVKRVYQLLEGGPCGQFYLGRLGEGVRAVKQESRTLNLT